MGGRPRFLRMDASPAARAKTKPGLPGRALTKPRVP